MDKRESRLIQIEDRLSEIEEYVARLKAEGIGVPNLTDAEITELTDEEVRKMLNSDMLADVDKYPDSYISEELVRRLPYEFIPFGKEYEHLSDGYPLCPHCLRPVKAAARRKICCPHCQTLQNA